MPVLFHSWNPACALVHACSGCALPCSKQQQPAMIQQRTFCLNAELCFFPPPTPSRYSVTSYYQQFKGGEEMPPAVYLL